mgnify:CR=1 FL=1
MRAVGENPNAASSVGQNVIKIRFLAIVLCGLMTGLGGMYLSMGYLTMFVRDMTAGRGFIALAACSMGQATPVGALLSSMIFAFLTACPIYFRYSKFRLSLFRCCHIWQPLLV